MRRPHLLLEHLQHLVGHLHVVFRNEAHDLHEHFNTPDTPINRLSARELSPGAATLAKINDSLRSP